MVKFCYNPRQLDFDNLTSLNTEDYLHMRTNNIITLWTLRILVHAKLLNRFIDDFGGFDNTQFVHGLGLDAISGRDCTDRKATQKWLSDYLKKVESKHTAKLDHTFSRNIEFLKEALALTQTELEIIRFVVIASSKHEFPALTDLLGQMSNEQIKQTLSKILNIPAQDIAQAIHTNGTLVSTGLLRIDASSNYLRTLFEVLDVPQNIRYALTREHANTADVLRSFVQISPDAILQLDDFQHVQADVDLMQRYITAAVNKKISGVNILISGAPGTGKTELVRTLTSACNMSLYEITMQDRHGEPIEGRDRFSALQLSQKLLANNQQCTILFDEIEDVFPAPNNHMFFGPVSGTDIKKAWVNHMLEKNSVPTFWVCNDTDQIDPAFLRRFDYTLKLRAPGRRARRRILEKYVGHLPVREHWLDYTAEHEHLAPAHIERAAKVVNQLEYDEPQMVEKTLDRIIGNTMEVMGLPRKPRVPSTQTTQYRLDVLNPDYDLTKLTKGLKSRPKARLCFYGPPGTGKTAFGHYLAEQLDKPLLVKRASDILSKWVGEAEKNIANMFQEAESENMVLLLDEADSFLRERSGANNSWEVTQVNELLVQMESFEGVFIASTNLMNILDAASLRRFDYKVKFDYMKPQQTWELFQQVLQEHGQPSPESTIRKQLSQLLTLTPGDFATVVRQARYMDNKLDSETLLSTLQKEVEAKPGSQKSIGFM